MVVFLTQSDDKGRNNFFGYDKICLIGYDYSWRPDGKYYSFDHDGGGKSNYMRHLHILNNNGDLAFTSGNLAFSAQWLDKYITTFKLPVVQCTKDTILGGNYTGDLDKNLSYRFNSEDAKLVREMIPRMNALKMEANKLDSKLRAIGREHFKAFQTSLY
jgi:hypothetical protein